VLGVSTRRGVISRMPVLPVERRASDAPDAAAGTRPRVTVPDAGVAVEGMTSRRPVVAAFPDAGLAEPVGVAGLR
jgi:hypothetical protein